MLYFDRTDVFVGIDVNKTNAENERIICRYWYFLDNGFKFQLDVCNRCQDVLMLSINLNDTAILNIPGFDYRCILNRISKSDAVNL